jgi:hypothetical protein
MTFDFVAYAKAYGVNGSRVESTDGLVPTLEATFARSGVQLVTVPIDFSENMRVLVGESRDPSIGERSSAIIRVARTFDPTLIVQLNHDDTLR